MSEQDESKTSDEQDETIEESDVMPIAREGESEGDESAGDESDAGDDGDDGDDDGDDAVEAEVETKAKTKAKAKDKGNDLMGKLVFVLGFVATLVIGYYVGQWVNLKFGDKPQPDSGDRYRVELRGDEPQLGPDDALVTIIEFADFQCPYCAQSVEPLHGAMDSYEGDVRLIFKHYPLPGHLRAAPASHASWAAHQQGKFWEFHDRLFEAKASIEKVPDWVKEFELDASKFGTDMESDAARDAIDNDMFAGAKVGVTGTPAFLVNGHMYRGKRDEVGWKKIIEAELEYAKEIADNEDLERGEVYAFLMKGALEKQVGAPDPSKPSERKRRPGEPDSTSVYAVPVTGAPAKGPADALVTVVEFADYHCPYCVKVQDSVDRLLREHPDEVRLVYRQRPLAMHKFARPASKAALAADKQGKFWEMHAKLFESQAKTLDQFKTLAEELGLDVEQFEADFNSPEVEQQLAADEAIATRFGVGGTPAFFINGRYLSGAQSYGTFEQLVQARLIEAKGMVEDGTPASGVYAKLIADGKQNSRE